MRVFFILTLAATLSASFAGPQPVDDRALEAAFLKSFGPLADNGEHVKVPDLIAQLKEQKRTFPVELLSPSAEKLTAAQIYKTRKDCVVALGNLYKCDKCDKWHTGLAGGVIVSADGLVLTNYHVIENDRAEILGAITASGTTHAVLEIIAASKDDDLALVKVDPAGAKLVPAPVAFDEPVGADVVTISHPDSRYFTLTKGSISRYFLHSRPREKKKLQRMAITADYARGSSGCPIFNDRGALVGLVSSTQSIYYSRDKGVQKNLQMVIKSAIPSSSIKRLFEEPEQDS